MIASSKDKGVLIRLPKRILEALDEAASRNGRSRNSEILMRLSDSLPGAAEKRSVKKKRTKMQ